MSNDAQRLVRIGRVMRAHGVRGEVAIKPDEPGSTTLLGQKAAWLRATDGMLTRVDIEATRAAHDVLLMRVAGCEDRTAAERLARHEVLLPRDWLPKLEAGEYYANDLLGLTVFSAGGEVLGRVVELIETGAVPVLEIEGDRRFQVPLVETYVRRIDLETRSIVVEPLEEE